MVLDFALKMVIRGWGLGENSLVIMVVTAVFKSA
jgi:hypothetical protein